MGKQSIITILFISLSFLFFTSFEKLDKLSLELDVKHKQVSEENIRKTIYEVAEELTGAPAWILKGIAVTESNERYTAVGDDGKSKGMMQLNEAFHEERAKKYGEYDPFNPLESLIVSGKLYIDNLRILGSQDLAIAAHRQGIDGVRKYGASEWYVKKVKAFSPIKRESK